MMPHNRKGSSRVTPLKSYDTVARHHVLHLPKPKIMPVIDLISLTIPAAHGLLLSHLRELVAPAGVNYLLTLCSFNYIGTSTGSLIKALRQYLPTYYFFRLPGMPEGSIFVAAAPYHILRLASMTSISLVPFSYPTAMVSSSAQKSSNPSLPT